MRYTDLLMPGIYERPDVRASMAALRTLDERVLLIAVLRARTPGLPAKLSPQVLRSMPGGPPPTNPDAVMFILAAAVVAVGAAIPLPEEAVTWPLLAPYLARQPQ